MDNLRFTIQFDVTPLNIGDVLNKIGNTVSVVGNSAKNTQDTVGNLTETFRNGKSSLVTFYDVATKIGFRLQDY
jgi:hypothetical protein